MINTLPMTDTLPTNWFGVAFFAIIIWPSTNHDHRQVIDVDHLPAILWRKGRYTSDNENNPTETSLNLNSWQEISYQYKKHKWHVQSLTALFIMGWIHRPTYHLWVQLFPDLLAAELNVTYTIPTWLYVKGRVLYFSFCASFYLL